MKRNRPVALLLIALLTILPSIPVLAGYDYNANCRKAFHLVMSLRFSEAVKILSAEKISDPGNAIPYLIDNYIDLLTVAIGQEPGMYEKLLKNKEERLSKMAKSGGKSPWYRFCISEIHLQWAVMKLFFSGKEIGLMDGISVALDINKVRNLTESLYKDHPDFLPGRLCRAIIHAISGAVTDEYPWSKYVLPLKGSIEGALKDMQNILDYSVRHENYSFLTDECLVYVTFMKLAWSPDKKAGFDLLKYYDDPSLKEVISTNPLLLYAKASVFIKAGMNDAAIKILSAAPSGPNYFPFLQLDFAYGKALLNKLDNRASLYFFKYLLHFKGKNQVRTAYRYIAWQYLINNDLAKYREYMKKCLGTGQHMNEADQQAYNDALRGSPPDISLLKSRLLFDGGYYEKAYEALTDFMRPSGVKTKKDTVEYYYRLGRICHEWGKQDSALFFYWKCMKENEGHSYYFAMNAAYQSGVIAENRKDVGKAEYFYKKCLSMEADEYKKGMRQRAKVALERIQSVAK